MIEDTAEDTGLPFSNKSWVEPSEPDTLAWASMVSIVAIATLSGLLFNPASAADWGYDSETTEQKPPAQTERPQTERPRAETHRLPSGKSTFRTRDVEELRAKPQTLELPPQGPGDKPAGKSGKPGKPPVQNAPEVDSQDEPADTSSVTRPEAVKNWIELLGLAAPLSDPEHLAPYPDFSKALTVEQKNRFAEMVTTMLSEQDPDVSSITTFWKALKPKLKGEEQRANYRHLFRALLRLRLNSGVATQTEKSLIEEALGPQRMVVDEGEVPFSEDAVNAYTDMAMFLYERHNPGKDINTDQNRELFSNVIRGRFREAPSDADRAAMNNFPLNWAKFRIVYTEANEEGKEVLEKAITSEDGVRRMTPRNAALDSVLQAPLWAKLIAKAQSKPAASASTPQPKHGAQTKSAPPRKSPPAKKRSASK